MWLVGRGDSFARPSPVPPLPSPSTHPDTSFGGSQLFCCGVVVKVVLWDGLTERLLHLVLAAVPWFTMPSHFYPCVFAVFFSTEGGDEKQ
jgi:hypothetical protein